MSHSTGNKPVHVFRRRGVKVSVFENQSGGATFYKVADQKIYRDEQGAYKTTHSYARDDIPVLQLMLSRAYEFILDQEAVPHEDAVEETNP